MGKMKKIEQQKSEDEHLQEEIVKKVFDTMVQEKCVPAGMTFSDLVEELKKRST